MYIDHIWPFTTFISRNKHNKNIRLRLYWLRLRVAEAEVQTSHDMGVVLIVGNFFRCPKFQWDDFFFHAIFIFEICLDGGAFFSMQNHLKNLGQLNISSWL